MINAAVPGYTSFQELTFFKRWVTQVDPDLVVWTYCLNDNHKYLHRFDQAANMLFTDEAARSLEIRTWWDWIVSRSYVLTTIRVGLLARQEPPTPRTAKFGWEARMDFNIAWKDYSWRFYESHLAEMVDLLHRRGTRLAIVVFPFEPSSSIATSATSATRSWCRSDIWSGCAGRMRSRASTSTRRSSARTTSGARSIATAST